MTSDGMGTYDRWVLGTYDRLVWVPVTDGYGYL